MKKRVTRKTAPVAPVIGLSLHGKFETGITKNQILSELSRSPHGALKEYVAVGQQAAVKEPEFFARLIAWDRQKGAIRDAKVALPVVSLSVPSFPDEFVDNSLAHIALLGPRELEKAFRFAMELKIPGRMMSLRRLVANYLRKREANDHDFDRVAVQHRDTLKTLYGLGHVKPSERADAILFKKLYPSGSVFEQIAQLKDMTPIQAAGVIVDRKIPFLIALGALGSKSKDPVLVQALIERMTATELVTNTKMLEKLGMKTNPALRATFEKGLEKVSKSSKNILKTTRAAENITDETLKAKLQGAQDRQIAASGGPSGDWLVLADRSGSMAQAIEVARHVAGVLAKFVKGKVFLVFFDTTPMTIDVTGMTMEQINAVTKHIRAGGGTSIGCGLQNILDRKIEIDGIAIVSDGDENGTPFFADVYKKYSEFFSKEVPVYLYECDATGETALHRSMQRAGLDMQTFSISGATDFYSLPNTVATMRESRYSLLDEVSATPLLTLDKVLGVKELVTV